MQTPQCDSASEIEHHGVEAKAFDAEASLARYQQSKALFERAQEIIPGGIHLSGRPLVDPASSPMYFDDAQGCRIRDVDGHEYIDYLMAYGAVLIGYAHPAVEQAAFEQASRGRLLSMNHPLHVRFVETLVARFPGAEMGLFFRSGSEATTAALRIARHYTGRRSAARSGYHGWHDWCLPREPFVPAGLDEQVPEFRAGDPSSLAAVLEAKPGSFAAVIVAPEMVLPFDPAVFHELKRIAHVHGAVFIMDEVKTALRVEPGSVAERVGLVPDLLASSKALGNGFAVAALVGKRSVMQAGCGMHYSATFHGDTSSMAAALETIRLIDALDVQAHVDRLGRRLIDGLNALAARHDVRAVAYGEPLPAMPFLRFQYASAAETSRASDTFYRSMLTRGVLMHPRHMWFISASHTPSDIALTLQAADEAFALLADGDGQT
jgi:glutamate-1-semialdehyde aminotransferase